MPDVSLKVSRSSVDTRIFGIPIGMQPRTVHAVAGDHAVTPLRLFQPTRYKAQQEFGERAFPACRLTKRLAGRLGVVEKFSDIGCNARFVSDFAQNI